IPDLRILERAAVPSIPTNDWMLNIIAGGLAGGPVLAALLALLLDLVDRRVRYPTQITSGLKLPIIGAIPHLKPGPNGADKAPAIEAFRGLQLNLIYAEQEPGPLVVTVTSPGPGDGKSFVSGNLALAFADAGYPTMLIDGDVRRGALHRQFSTSQRPGLTDVLSGKIQETATHETDVSRLHFLPCGTRIGRAPELLGSPAMTQLLNALRKRYSVIVVDSPPLGAGMDAYALGAATGNLLVVVRSGST